MMMDNLVDGLDEIKNKLSNDSNKTANNNLSFAFTNNKAGMEGLDREEIDKIVFEATKDSVITKKKLEDNEKLKHIVEDYKLRLESLHKNEILLEQNKRLCETRIKDLKKERILSRTWMHIDMDMFYAAVEIRDNPELNNKPVVVGTERMVATSNYIARKFGVRSAMPGFIAKKLCKDLIFINPNFYKYEDESKKIMSVLKEYDPDIDIRGLDEAYLDLTNYCHNNYITTENETRQLIDEIKIKIFDQTKLTSSCGIACNKMLAKICSDIHKPDGVFLLPNDEQDICNFMSKLKIRKIPNVGEKFEKKLNLIEIFTCEDVISNSVNLYHLLSDNQFDFLLSAAYGIGSCYHEEVKNAISKSISCSETFRVTNDIEFINKTFLSLCKKLHQNMIELSVIARTLTIEITDKTEKHVAKSLSLIKKFETESELINNGWSLLKSMIEGTSIRLIRVKIGSLSQINPETIKRNEHNDIKLWINKLNTGDNNVPSAENNIKKVKIPVEKLIKSPPIRQYLKLDDMFANAHSYIRKTKEDQSLINSENSKSSKEGIKRFSNDKRNSTQRKKNKNILNNNDTSKNLGPLDSFIIKANNCK